MAYPNDANAEVTTTLQAWLGETAEKLGLEAVAAEIEIPAHTLAFALQSDNPPNGALLHRLRSFRAKTNGRRGPVLGADAGALLSEYADGKRDFSDSKLAGADLRGAWMPDCSFARADFSAANLKDAWLLGGDFTVALMEQSVVDGANLSLSNMVGFVGTGASMKDTGLAAADMRNATLDWSALSGACLAAAQMQGAKLQGASLINANLMCADLSDAFIDGARFDGARLDWAILPAGIDVNGVADAG